MHQLNWKVICLLSFLMTSIGLFAQQDSLTLYTKPNCSDCKATKQALRQAGVPFLEKSLDNGSYASEMLRKLAQAGYHDKIYLPVIFANKKVLHPAYKVDSGLVAMALPSVVDSILMQVRSGRLHPVGTSVEVAKTAISNTTSDSDCEVKTVPIYVVCASFKTEEEAIDLMNKLLAAGNIYAGIIFSQKEYRVYTSFYTEKNLAEAALTNAKAKFKEAYLYENR